MIQKYLTTCTLIVTASVLIGLFQILLCVSHQRRDVADIESKSSAASTIAVTGIELKAQDGPQTWFYHGGSINETGTVVSGASGQAAEWENGHFKEMSIAPNISESAALGVNRAGEAVGFSIHGSEILQATIWKESSSFTLAGLPGFPDSEGNAINQKGDVAGRAFADGFKGPWWAVPGHGFLWKDGHMQDLIPPPHCTISRAYGLNDGDQVVGWALTDQNRTHACLWDNGKAYDLGTLPGGHVSTAVAINNLGIIAGDSDARDGRVHAVVWKDREIVDLGLPPTCFKCKPKAINDAGEILIDASSGTPAWSVDRVVVWESKLGFRNIALPESCLWTLQRAVALGQNGTIVVAGTSSEQNEVFDHRMFVLTPVLGVSE